MPKSFAMQRRPRPLLAALLVALPSAAAGLKLFGGNGAPQPLAPYTDDPKDAIFAMACGSPVGDVTVFVKSLRAANYTGTVRMGVWAPSLPAATQAWLKESGIQLDEQPCDDVAKRAAAGEGFLGSLQQRKFATYKKWLGEGDYHTVWLLDTTDVYFQDHPFKNLNLISRDGLNLFASSALFVHSMSERKIARTSCGMPTVIGSVLMGSASRLAALCDELTRLGEEPTGIVKKVAQVCDMGTAQKTAGYCDANDQPLLSLHLTRQNVTSCGNFSYASVHDSWEGAALTMTHSKENRAGAGYMNDGSCSLLTIKQRGGVLVDTRGLPIPVVHQWSGCTGLKKLLPKAFQWFEEATNATPAK